MTSGITQKPCDNIIDKVRDRKKAWNYRQRFSDYIHFAVHVGSQAIREKREWTKLFSQLGLTDTRKFRSRQHLSDAPSSVKTKVSSQWKAVPFTTNQWTDKDLGILISFSRNPDYFIYCTLGWGLKSAITLSGKKGNWERQHFPMASNWFEERSTRHLAAARRIMSSFNHFLLRNGKSWT